VRCIAHVQVVGNGVRPDFEHVVTFVPQKSFSPNVLPLRREHGRADLKLSISFRYTVVNTATVDNRMSYRVAESAYIYRILDRGDREVFAYHWHPNGLSSIVYPHFHLSGVGPIALTVPESGSISDLSMSKAHFPTGHVTLQQVIRLLIEDFGVEPRTPGWREALTVEH